MASSCARTWPWRVASRRRLPLAPAAHKFVHCMFLSSPPRRVRPRAWQAWSDGSRISVVRAPICSSSAAAAGTTALYRSGKRSTSSPATAGPPTGGRRIGGSVAASAYRKTASSTLTFMVTRSVDSAGRQRWQRSKRRYVPDCARRRRGSHWRSGTALPRPNENGSFKIFSMAPSLVSRAGLNRCSGRDSQLPTTICRCAPDRDSGAACIRAAADQTGGNRRRLPPPCYFTFLRLPG